MPAPKGNQNAKGNKGGGRPSLYKPQYAQLARRVALLGATDAELAGILEVSETTINAWKRAHVEFADALKDGKDAADAMVADRLYKRALGYSHKAVKIITVPRGNNQGSDVEKVPYVERYPPDTTACIFWLKNRRPAQWRDRQEEQPQDVAETARQLREALKAMDAADQGSEDAAA